MGDRLEWDKLLSEERCRESTTKVNSSYDKNHEFYDHRNEFDKDYDRIVYSSSVRRLQDKAQVFPLQENDFTRTRLTHSIEASALGRSLGYAVGEWLLDTGEFKSYVQVRKLSALLQVSALIHDLGNPPFGHYGEDIIRNWFNRWFKTESFTEINNGYSEKKLTEQQKEDLESFEGNAQTLRIVSKLQLLNDEYGANFTYGTLATIMKYPWASLDERADTGHGKKFGYFSSEQELVRQIQKATGLEDGIRHPATFLLEASDDIAYLLADVEDAVKKGIISWKEEYNKIKDNLLKKDSDTYGYIFSKLDDIYNKNESNQIPNDDLIAFQNFKIFAQGLMFKQVVKAFKEKYNSIMLGEYKGELLKDGKAALLVKELKILTQEFCFPNEEVLTLELVGDNVINGLLDKFVEPLVKCTEEPVSKCYEGKLYSLISSNFKYICCLDKHSKEIQPFCNVGLYERLLLITDFISGMTDSYAVNLYKRLLGVKLP